MMEGIHGHQSLQHQSLLFNSGEYTGITSGGGLKVVGDRIWFGTNQGRIYHSNDKGLTWSVTSTP